VSHDLFDQASATSLSNILKVFEHPFQQSVKTAMRALLVKIFKTPMVLSLSVYR